MLCVNIHSAVTASVRLLLSMNCDMLKQTALCAEVLIAVHSLVKRFARVSKEVFEKVLLPTKAFVTMIARKWLLSTVSYHVSMQILLASDALVAVRALVMLDQHLTIICLPQRLGDM